MQSLSEQVDVEYVFYNQSWKNYIDGKNSTGITQLINDCGNGSRPNIVPRIHTDKKKQRHIEIIALIDIAKDDELVYNYGGAHGRDLAVKSNSADATKLPILKPKPASVVNSDTISIPELVKKLSTVCTTDVSSLATTEKNTTVMQTIPSSSVINWKMPKCDEEGHILIDFDLKNKSKRIRKDWRDKRQ